MKMLSSVDKAQRFDGVRAPRSWGARFTGMLVFTACLAFVAALPDLLKFLGSWKHAWKVLVPALLVCASLHAQTTKIAPDCPIVLAARSTTGTSSVYDNRPPSASTSPCTEFILTASATTANASFTVAVEGAQDNGAASCAGCSWSTIGSLTLSAEGTKTATKIYADYVRINLSAISGGTVSAAVSAWRPNQSTTAGSGGGGGGMCPGGSATDIQVSDGTNCVGFADLIYTSSGLSVLNALGVGPVSIVSSTNPSGAFATSYPTILDVEQTVTDISGITIPLALGTTYNPTSTNSNPVWNMYSELFVTGSSNVTGENIGGFFELDCNITGTTGCGGDALDAEAYLDQGTTTVGFSGVQALVGNFGAGLLTGPADAYYANLGGSGGPIGTYNGLHIGKSGNESTVTTTRGILIESKTAATTARGIEIQLSASETGQVITRASGQTADFIDLLDSDGITLLAHLDANAKGFFPNLNDAGLTATTPVISDASKNLASGSYHGNPSVFQMSDGTGISGNLASYNADGRVTDSNVPAALNATTASLNLGSVSDGTCVEANFTLAGASTTNDLAGIDPTADGVQVTYKVASSNTIRVKECNFTGSAYNPGSLTYGAAVIR